jgi:hypothetical protein
MRQSGTLGNMQGLLFVKFGLTFLTRIKSRNAFESTKGVLT